MKINYLLRSSRYFSETKCLQIKFILNKNRLRAIVILCSQINARLRKNSEVNHTESFFRICLELFSGKFLVIFRTDMGND